MALTQENIAAARELCIELAQNEDGMNCRGNPNQGTACGKCGRCISILICRLLAEQKSSDMKWKAALDKLRESIKYLISEWKICGNCAHFNHDTGECNVDGSVTATVLNACAQWKFTTNHYTMKA
jgi:hypothetical protein